MSESIQAFFKNIDKDLIGLKKCSDETFVYNAQDVLIQQHWELPIIIQWPKSKINFEFSSVQGDLSFSIMFVAALEEGQDENDLEVETIEEMVRTTSGTEMQEGSFELPVEGVLFFVWDNSFDWSANKKLSYSIEVIQPSFSHPESERLKKVKPLLMDALEVIETSSIRLADAEDYIIYQGNNVLRIEEQIKQLELELASKHAELEVSEREEQECLDIIEDYFDRIGGIGIRCLNKHLLSYVFGFLNLEGGVNHISKYWADIAKNCRISPVSRAEVTNIKPVPPSVRRLSSQTRAEVARKKYESPSTTNPKDSLLGVPKSSLEVRRQKAAASQFTRPRKIDPVARRYIEDDEIVARGGGKVTSNIHSLIPGSGIDGTMFIELQPQLIGVVGADTSDVVDKPDEREGTVASGAATGGTAGTGGGNIGAPRSLGAGTTGDDANEPGDAAHRNGSIPAVGPGPGPGPGVPAKSPQPNIATASAPSRDLDIPVVAEGKGTRASQKKPTGADGRRGLKSGNPDTANGMMMHVKKIRSEQQLSALIDYIQAGYVKIENLENEKRRLKKQIRAWNTAFEKSNGRPASTKERKLLMKEQYLDYEQVSAMLKVRTTKMEELLQSVGITQNDFIRLRDRRTAEWINNAHLNKIDKHQFESLITPSPSKNPAGASGK